MKTRIFPAILLLSLIASRPSFAGFFTGGDLVVVQDGTGAAPLTSAATQVNLVEFSTLGAIVQSIALPTTASGSNLAFTDSGSATSDGALTLSSDGHSLSLTGYNAAVGTASVVSTSSATNARVVASVNAAGQVNTSTQITDAYSANNIRGAVTTNGSTFYTSGTASTTGGTREVAAGSSGASTQISSSVTNTRVVNIYNGQLYTSSASGTFVGISAVGTGLPTTGGQTTTLITSGTPANATSPYGFVFLGNNLYVVDDSAGLLKYTFSTSDMKYDYVGTLSTTKGLTGLTGTLGANGDEVLYATNPTSLYTFDDNNLGTVTSKLLATAATNTAFRGIAFAPTAAAAAVPEPASIVMTGLGALGVAFLARRRKARIA